MKKKVILIFLLTFAEKKSSSDNNDRITNIIKTKKNVDFSQIEYSRLDPPWEILPTMVRFGGQNGGYKYYPFLMF